MDADVKQLSKLLLRYKGLPVINHNRTFLEISGYPHYENVCSNILQFFLNPCNEHGLKDLVLNALVRLVDKEFSFDNDYEYIQVERETKTLAGNRLDLLVKTERYVIGIENKVYHFLNNDLQDYSDTIKSYCVYPKKTAINIILSLYQLTQKEDIVYAKKNDFKTVTYDELFLSIKKDLGKYLSHSNPTYFIYLSDFIKSIQNLKPSTMQNMPLRSFFKENAKILQELTDNFNDYKNSLYQKIDQLKPFILASEFPGLDEQWVYKDGNKTCLVHDYTFSGRYKIAIDTWIRPTGWVLHLFARDSSGSKQYLFEKMCKQPDFLPEPFDTYNNDSELIERLVIGQFDVDADLEIVAKTLKEYLRRLEQVKNAVK